MKVVINRCYGGFGLSPKAVMRYGELSGQRIYAYSDTPSTKLNFNDGTSTRLDTIEQIEKAFVIYYLTVDIGPSGKLPQGSGWFHQGDIKRNDPILVQVVEDLGDEAGDKFASLKVVEIPDGVDYEIDKYDGLEHIAERHNTWS